MSTHKHIDKICLAAALVCLLLLLAFLNAEALGIEVSPNSMGYEGRLFDTSRVHTIDIVMNDWEEFLETCENEEYSVCAVVIDGVSYKNVGIRAKGNSSLSSVSRSDSDRYSFKIEFDQYDSTKSYYGLDKISLNNIIQDNTYLKDYLTYQMMGCFGVNAPLCSYTYIMVNGEDWGLYLAVEGIEDGFLQRNYGSNAGNLYKPDSTDMGGGPGGGKDFDMEKFMNDQGENAADVTKGEPVRPESGGEQPNMTGESPTESVEPAEGGGVPGNRPGRGGMGGFSSMGSADIKLQYIDDDTDSYSNIFDNAKTDITEADKTRLIQSLKDLSEGKNLEKVVDVEAVIRYFVVHNFVCNGDSYTGSMVHNYYLYEKDGQLSMLPWDYNLAFGSFQSSDATSSVNAPIDTPVSGGDSEDRPMLAWIFSSEEYTVLYHQYFAEFLDTTDFTALIDEAATLIAPYVEKDPTKFCTYEEFQTGVSTLRSFCLLRKESIQGQLDGYIPATSDGQTAQPEVRVDASAITISDMGTMGMGGRGGIEKASGVFPFDQASAGADADGISLPTGTNPQRPQNQEEADTEAEIPPPQQNGDSVPGKRAPNNSQTNENPQTSTKSLILLGVSLLVLTAGLWSAFRFKR